VGAAAGHWASEGTAARASASRAGAAEGAGARRGRRRRRARPHRGRQRRGGRSGGSPAGPLQTRTLGRSSCRLAARREALGLRPDPVLLLLLLGWRRERRSHKGLECRQGGSSGRGRGRGRGVTRGGRLRVKAKGSSWRPCGGSRRSRAGAQEGLFQGDRGEIARPGDRELPPGHHSSSHRPGWGRRRRRGHLRRRRRGAARGSRLCKLGVDEGDELA